MKFISWNVNGLRACMGKGFMETFNAADADFFCIQETKMQPNQLTLDLPGYQQYWYSAERKGYSGTATFSKHEPLSVTYGLPQDIHNHEGRAITLEFDKGVPVALNDEKMSAKDIILKLNELIADGRILHKRNEHFIMDPLIF